MIDGLHGEVPRHEFNNGSKAEETGADTNTGEASLSDRSVPDSSFTELVEHTLGDLVGTLVLADLLTHEENIVVTTHLIRHGDTERISHSHLHKVKSNRVRLAGRLLCTYDFIGRSAGVEAGLLHGGDRSQRVSGSLGHDGSRQHI